MTETEIARRCAEAMYDADVASQHLGIVISDVAPGRAFACNTYDERTVAAGADINFLSPVIAGDVLTATASERSRRGRSGIYDVTVRTADDTIVAEFRGRSRSLGSPLLSD